MFGNLDDPKQQMLLAMGLGLLGNQSGNIGQDIGKAGLLGLNAYNTGQSRKAKLAEEEQQRQLRAAQLAQLKKQQEDQAYAAQIAPQFFNPGAPAPQYNDALGDGTQGAIGPAKPPRADFSGYGMALAGRNPQMGMPFIQAGMKDETPLVGKPGDVFLDRKTYKPMAAIPQAPKDWEDPRYIAAQKEIRAAGRPQISTTTNVMPPREVFKDSIALKKDFDAQPEVKGFKEIQSAWDQISTALQRPSPANDMSAATKFMKLIDPGSVVRESELMMAMQASGAWDRFLNTADRVLKGHKLTPEQRKDFYEAGNALFEASKERFGQTVTQYEGIAAKYNLDGQFIQNAKPRSSGGWSMERVE